MSKKIKWEMSDTENGKDIDKNELKDQITSNESQIFEWVIVMKSLDHGFFFPLHHYSMYAIHIMHIAFRLFCSCFQIYLSLEGHLSVCVQFLLDFSSLFSCRWLLIDKETLCLVYTVYILLKLGFFSWRHLTVYLREYIYLIYPLTIMMHLMHLVC